MRGLSIGGAAAILGVTVQTLRRWERSGRLMSAFRTFGGHRRYDVADVLKAAGKQAATGRTICYARVSCADQRDDLVRQAERLEAFCGERGYEHVEVISDLGSGLNYAKKGLRRLIGLICGRKVDRLVVEHKDRLLRFGAELVFQVCAAFGVEVVVVEPPAENFEGRLVEDVLDLRLRPAALAQI